MQERRTVSSGKRIRAKNTPLNPTFTKQNWSMQGYTYFFFILFYFLHQHIDRVYTSEPPRRGGSNMYPQSMFRAKIRKILNKSCRRTA